MIKPHGTRIVGSILNFLTMLKLSILNSRMKDFFYIWLMSRQFDFEGPILAEAISKTFSTRGTNIQGESIALTTAFAEDTAKAAQWRVLIRRNRIKDAPQNLSDVVTGIAAFLTPIAEELAVGCVLKTTWKAPDPWRE